MGLARDGLCLGEEEEFPRRAQTLGLGYEFALADSKLGAAEEDAGFAHRVTIIRHRTLGQPGLDLTQTC